MEGDLEEVMRLVQGNLALVNSRDEAELTALYHALIRGHFDVADYLLSQGADINLVDNLNRRRTILHRLCSSARVGVVEFTLSRGANPTATDSWLWTPLILVAQSGRWALVECLLRIKAVRDTIDSPNSDGETALWRAARCGHEKVVKLLLEAGANPMISNKGRYCFTPKEIAHSKGNCKRPRAPPLRRVLQVRDGKAVGAAIASATVR